MKINFFSEDVPFKISKPSVIRKWMSEVAAKEQHLIKELNYIFCSDGYLHAINVQYLGHDTYTDIITFDHSDEQNVVAGDIYVSVERVKENAKTYASDFDDELHRVMIHGILHLCGYKDKTSDEEQAMRKKEDACLSLLRIS